jgi:hypothetical protein
MSGLRIAFLIVLISLITVTMGEPEAGLQEQRKKCKPVQAAWRNKV